MRMGDPFLCGVTRKETKVNRLKAVRLTGMNTAMIPAIPTLIIGLEPTPYTKDTIEDRSLPALDSYSL